MKTNQTYDVIITGGGIMGSATAYYLTKADPALKVAVVERDPSYARASTALSMSNVRIQFSLKENIQISQYAFQVLERFEEEMAVEDRTPRIYFHREGNLFLVGEQNLAAARRAFDLKCSLGCRIEWWSPDEIKQHYPLYETS
ncbi:MAG: FAD-dependent oxidoreductase, partial [Deltaproteobacteria bacterium]|nr:FAD-dependent oxidoreductase [Deltaproteobacteria bacterium]